MARSTPDPAQAKDARTPDFVQRGKVLMVRHQFQEAVKICRLGLLAHPTCVEGRLVLGMALMALSRFDEVLSEMRVALELEPQNPIAHLLKGEALFRRHDLAQARAVLEQAHELDPLNAKINSLLEDIEEVADYGPESGSRNRTETKVYPAQRAQALASSREPSEVLDHIRPLPRAQEPPEESTGVGDGPARLEDGGPTEPDPLSDREDLEEGEEYTTAPFLPPTHLAGVGRHHPREGWDEQTVAEAPPGLEELRGLQPNDTVERDDEAADPGGELVAGRPLEAGSDPALLASFATAPSQAALPQWDTSDLALEGGTEEQPLRPADDDLDEPTATSLPPEVESGLRALFARDGGEAAAGDQDDDGEDGEDDQKTAVNAEAPPPEALFGDASEGAGWPGRQPRNSADSTRALTLGQVPQSDPAALTAARLERPAPKGDTPRPLQASPSLSVALFAAAEQGSHGQSVLAEISVEMLPDEMPPLPPDAATGLKQIDSDGFPVLPPTSSAAAAPAPAPEEEDEFATRVNFDPAEEAARLAAKGVRLAPSPALQPEPSYDPVQPAPSPRSGALQQAPSLSDRDSDAALRASFGDPGFGLEPEPSFDDEGLASLNPGVSFTPPDSLVGGLEPDLSYPPAGAEGLPGGRSYEQPSYRDPIDESVGPARVEAAPPRRFDFEPAPPLRPGRRPPDPAPSFPVEPEDSDPQWEPSQRAGSRPRTAALEDQGRAYPYLEEASPRPRETVAGGPRGMRQAPNRPASVDDRSSELFRERVGAATPAPRRKPRHTGERTHTSFLTLLIGEPGSHRGLYLLAGAVAVLATAVGIGLAVRYLRLGEQINNKREQAELRLRLGNFADYSAAAQSQEDILNRRSGDLQAIWAHNLIQAAMPFEFGDENPNPPRAAEATEENNPDRLATEVYQALNAGTLKKAAELVKKARAQFPDDPLLSYLQGRIYLLQGDPAEAEQALQLAIERGPPRPLYLRALGEARAAQRRYQEAREAYEEALKVNGQHVGSVLGIAQSLIAEGGEAETQLARIKPGVASRGQLGWASLLRAERHLRKGEMEEGKKALESARSSAPFRDPGFHDEMARVLIQSFQLPAAEQAVKASKDAMDGRPQPYYYQAQILLRNGMPREAVVELEKAAALGFAASALLRAEIYLQMNQLDKAQAAIDQALAMPAADRLDAYVVQARIRTARKEFAKAQQDLESLVEKNDKDARLLTALGEVLMAAGKRAEARKNFEAAIKHDRNAVEAKLKLAEVLALEGSWEKARQTLDETGRANYGNAAVYKALARLEEDIGDLGEAVSDYKHALRLAPGDVDVRLGLARALLLLRDLGQAESVLNQPVKQSGDVAALALGRARLALTRGRPAEAVRQLEQARASQREKPELWDLMVRAQLEGQDEKAARRSAAEMLRLLPGLPEAELISARVDYAGGNLAAAIRRLGAVLHLLGRHPRPPTFQAEVLVLLGRAHQENGSPALANDHFIKATAVCSRCPDPHFYRALLLDERGNAEEALRGLEQVLKLDPRRAETYQWQGVILERQGQIERAREAYQKCLTLNPTEDHRAAATEALQNLGQR